MTGGGYEEFEGYRGGGGYYGKIIKAFLWPIENNIDQNDNNI